MKIYKTKHFPFGKFAAINIFGKLYIKDEYNSSIIDMIMRPSCYIKLIQHERTHTYQQKDLLYVFFYILYVIEWFFKVITTLKGYKNLSFEREARHNAEDCDSYSVNVKLKHQKKFRIYTTANGNYYRAISIAVKSVKDLEYIEFKPFNERGSLINRRWGNWFKFLIKE